MCPSSLSHLSFSPGSTKEDLSFFPFPLSQSKSANAAVRPVLGLGLGTYYGSTRVYAGLRVVRRKSGFLNLCTFTTWASVLGEGRETLSWVLQSVFTPSPDRPASATATVKLLKAFVSVTANMPNSVYSKQPCTAFPFLQRDSKSALSSLIPPLDYLTHSASFLHADLHLAL